MTSDRQRLDDFYLKQIKDWTYLLSRIEIVERKVLTDALFPVVSLIFTSDGSNIE